MKYGTTAGVLKPLDQVMQPDPRFKIHVIENESGIRPFQLEDIHQRLCLTKLNDEVPQDVRTQFHTAINLMLYAWFVFEFQTVAEHHAYATLEFALRTRFPEATKKIIRKKREVIEPLTLGPLLRLALEKGVILAERLPAWERVKANRKFYEECSPFPLAPMPAAKEWLDQVAETIPDFRNALAHGKPKLYLHGSFWALELCADLINALFPIAHEKCETTNK